MNVQDRTLENPCHDYRLRPLGLFADNSRLYEEAELCDFLTFS